MELFKVFDAYSLRARLFPAVIAAAPAFAALALLISWKTFALSNLIASLGTLVLLYAIADFARAQGREIQAKLYSDYGGMPSIVMFRRNDPSIDAASKDRYRDAVAKKLGVTVPSAEVEAADQATADAFYSQCCNWLLENTRDTKKYPLLFGENVTYGFRRNLFGVKALALWLNAIVVCVCVVILWRVSWNLNSPHSSAILVVLIVAAAHAAYMMLAVTRKAVWDASRAYGRELIMSAGTFASPVKTARRPAARKAAPAASEKP